MYFSEFIDFFFLFSKCATVELPHVNGAKKADNCFLFFSVSFGFFFSFPRVNKKRNAK